MALANEFLRVAWSAKVPDICPHCHADILDTSMHPCGNGDWTCRCILCLGLLYRVTSERVIYWPEAGQFSEFKKVE